MSEREVRRKEYRAIREIEGIFDEIIENIIRDLPEVGEQRAFDLIDHHFDAIHLPITHQRIFRLLKDIYVFSFNSALEKLKKMGVLESSISAANIPSDYDVHRLTGLTLSHLANISEDIKRKMKNSLADGYLEGESIEELSRRVRVIWEVDRHRATRLARTVTNEVYNTGHLEAYSFSGVVKKVEYVAALDERTSEICRRMHGSVWEISDPSILKPPLHFNCRSRLVPYFGRKKSAAKLPMKLMRQVARFRTEFADEGKKFERILRREVKKRAKKTVKIPVKELSERDRDRIIAEELWEKTERNKREFAAIVTERGELRRVSGRKHSVNTWNAVEDLESAGIKYESYHSHPNDVVAPSFNDIAVLILRKNQIKEKIVGKKKIFIVEKTKDTPSAKDLGWQHRFSSQALSPEAERVRSEYEELANKYFKKLKDEVPDVYERTEIAYRQALKDLNRMYNLNLKFEEIMR